MASYLGGEQEADHDWHEDGESAGDHHLLDCEKAPIHSQEKEPHRRPVDESENLESGISTGPHEPVSLVFERQALFRGQHAYA